MTKLTVSATDGVLGLELDGVDISSAVRQVQFAVTAGQQAVAFVDLVAEVEWSGDVQVTLRRAAPSADWIRQFMGNSSFRERFDEVYSQSAMDDHSADIALRVLAEIAEVGDASVHAHGTES